MRPVAQSDGHDVPGLVDERVPGIAAMVDDVCVGCEYAVRKPVVAHELPDVFLRVEFRAFRRQGDEGDGVWHHEAFRHVPTGLIEKDHGVAAGGDLFGDFGEMQVHRFGVAARQDQGSTFSVFRADGAENVGRGGALVEGR